ncbi:MAG TPA: hypothetical protein VK203_07160 [Nostocaceae cyanobacterium]|nr:hypothetical protein [Nostocaceae cyanobacterium]
MLKPLLLSGWFRFQPLLKYFVVLLLIAPVVGWSIHSTAAKQSEVKKVTLKFKESGTLSQTVAVTPGVDVTAQMPLNGEAQILTTEQINSGVRQQIQQSNRPMTVDEMLAAAQVQPLVELPIDQPSLREKLKELEIETNSQLISQDFGVQPLAATKVAPKDRETQTPVVTETPTSEPPSDVDAIPADPIGSPHPIPWKWIMVTQETVGAKGGSGVRYYRSVPVISPDRKYAVYSRVQMEVKPEMYNSRVSSILFVQDMQTKRLRVMAATSTYDPLLKRPAAPQDEPTEGKIGVLVPVSWSQKGDRFLARQFEGIFNTADATDSAVIWDRQKNHASTVAPAQAADEHEKIAILLGWSKSQPENVLFRAGELGEENWPLVQVAIDGKTVQMTQDGDQPITFGEIVTPVWAEPQVASR